MILWSVLNISLTDGPYSFTFLGHDDDNDAYQRGNISSEEIERRTYAKKEERLKSGFDAAE